MDPRLRLGDRGSRTRRRPTARRRPRACAGCSASRSPCAAGCSGRCWPRSGRSGAFDDDEVRLLSGLAAHAAVAIDNARSRQQLAESEAALQDTLRLDAALTAAVLEGGDLDSLLERVRAMTPTRLDWLDPDAAQQPHPGTVQPVVAAGDLLGALAVDDRRTRRPTSCCSWSAPRPCSR